MITITIITIDEEEEDGALKRKERLIVVINRLIKHCSKSKIPMMVMQIMILMKITMERLKKRKERLIMVINRLIKHCR